jgi:hypothetical protein
MYYNEKKHWGGIYGRNKALCAVGYDEQLHD